MKIVWATHRNATLFHYEKKKLFLQRITSNRKSIEENAQRYTIEAFYLVFHESVKYMQINIYSYTFLLHYIGL